MIRSQNNLLTVLSRAEIHNLIAHCVASTKIIFTGWLTMARLVHNNHSRISKLEIRMTSSLGFTFQILVTSSRLFLSQGENEYMDAVLLREGFTNGQVEPKKKPMQVIRSLLNSGKVHIPLNVTCRS